MRWPVLHRFRPSSCHIIRRFAHNPLARVLLDEDQETEHPVLVGSCSTMEDADAGGLAAARSPSTPDAVESSPPPAESTPADGLPLLRLVFQEAPVHGVESTKFTIEVHHGGYFMRSGQNISYVDEKSTIWFDNLDRDTFCMDIYDNLVSRLGYVKRKYVFWCPPGKALDELVEVWREKHCQLMSKASVETKVLTLFVHHVDDNEQMVKDELSQEGGPEDSEDSEQENDYQCDSDGDPAWHDSDYDMQEDDDLFADYVDDSEADVMVDKGKQLATQHAHVPGADDVNEVDLELPVEDDGERRHKSDSDDEEYKKKKKKKQVVYKFKPFNSAGDKDDPKFKIGMVFDSVEVLRRAVSQYAIRRRIMVHQIWTHISPLCKQKENVLLP